MRSILTVLIISFLSTFTMAQSASDSDGVRAACMNYLEGFYEGDTTKLIASLQPSLNKLGFWKAKDTDIYESQGYMTFEEAKAYAKGVAEKKRFPSPEAPKEVEVLDVMNNTASAKVTAWWGTDYILLSKHQDKWMIEQVLWEGPLEK